MKLYIADAFAEKPFCGNPAGVVILPEGAQFGPEETMLKTAAELRYSETAFVRRTGENEFCLRFFTPKSQVDLCGHAAVAAFGALRHGGYIGDKCVCRAKTNSGELTIRVDGPFVMMDMAEPVLLKEVEDEEAKAELYAAAGLSYVDQTEKGLRLPVQIISTGLPDIMLPVADRASLLAAKPVFSALAAISERYGAVGMHAFSLGETGGPNCYARNFAPLYGIDEEAATGTASGALTYYGYRNGLIKAGEENRFLQGESMGRPSSILTRLDEAPQSGRCHIRVGGMSVILVEGEIFL